MKRHNPVLLAILFGICVGAVIMGSIPFIRMYMAVRQGEKMMADLKYDEKNLLGLTSAQVIHNLGTPAWDPRVSKGPNDKPWKDEQTNGPLFLIYDINGAGGSIEFKNDRVVESHRMVK